MAVNIPGFNDAYGLQNPLQVVSTPPIVSKRAPTISDGAPLGTIWIYQPGNASYILVNNTGGSNNWINYSVTPFAANVTNAVTPYTALPTDQFISVDSSAGVVTVTLPAAPVIGRTFTIKDVGGAAATHTITVSAGGTTDINGATTATITTNYAFIHVVFNGTKYLTY